MTQNVASALVDANPLSNMFPPLVYRTTTYAVPDRARAKGRAFIRVENAASMVRTYTPGMVSARPVNVFASVSRKPVESRNSVENLFMSEYAEWDAIDA